MPMILLLTNLPHEYTRFLHSAPLPYWRVRHQRSGQAELQMIVAYQLPTMQNAACHAKAQEGL